MNGLRLSSGKRGSALRLAGIVLTLAAPALLLHGQDIAPDPAALLRATPNDAERCNGPLGNLIPECKEGKTAININTHNPLGDSPLSPGLRIPGTREPRAGLETGQETPVAPEPPTEFQRFVASSTGELLPIFGAGLFQNVPSTFAPMDRVPVTADYLIGPGDEILLRVWGQINLDVALTVDRAGAIFVPDAGNINVAGIRFQQLAPYLHSQLGRVFRNFDLNVNMGQLRSIQIFVVGQTRRPGTYTVSSLSTLVNALFASGGPSAHGSLRSIQLKRDAVVITVLDLYDLLLGGDKSKDVRLQPGDVVYIPPVGVQIAVAGCVKAPAIYELKAEKTIDDVVAMAGGLSILASAERVTLERIQQHTSREFLELKLDSAGLRTPVKDGDVLRIVPVTPQIGNVVTLRGNVANPGRFPWHTGLRIHDVIPDKQSLVTREYWRSRNLLGFTSAEAMLPADSPTTRAAEAAEPAPRPPAIKVSTDLSDINWAYAVVERQNPANLTTDLLPFHLGKLILENDETQNLELQPGDVITIFSQADIRGAMAQQTRIVRLEGEFAAAGIYAVRPGETLGHLIERAGGLTPQAYLYGSEFLRESTRIDQQRRLDQFIQELEQDVEHTGSNRLTASATPEDTALVATKLQSERSIVEKLHAVRATGRIVLNLDPATNDIGKLADFPLEDGDRFVVPPRPATVNVLGAVYNQNSFLYDPAERVTDYLRQAGGANRNADKSRIFVIRADGSVVPRQGFNLFSQSFEAARLNPGDSVVVPEAIFKGGVLRGFRDWTQILSQFALGAAAINVLK